jgi:hypothetical protein
MSAEYGFTPAMQNRLQHVIAMALFKTGIIDRTDKSLNLIFASLAILFLVMFIDIDNSKAVLGTCGRRLHLFLGSWWLFAVS